MAIKDSTFMQRFPWQCLIVDEAHRLKNSSSLLYRLLKEVVYCFMADILVGMYIMVSLLNSSR